MVECTFSINRMLEVVEHCNNYCIFDLHVFGTRLIPEGMTLLVQLLAAGTLFVLDLVSKGRNGSRIYNFVYRPLWASWLRIFSSRGFIST